jgi:hypothetical protein
VLCGSKSAKPWLLLVVQKILNITPDDHCQAVLDVMPGPWRSSSWWNRNQDLYTLLSRFVDSQATEPRDLIYALRGMSSDAKGAPDLYPDYTKFEEQLVRDTILFMYPVQNEDLAALQLPMTIHEFIFDLGKLGHRIYCKMFAKITRENLDDLTRFAQTQTWHLISPYRMQEKRWATEQRYVYSPSAVRSRLLLAKLQSDQTGDAAALFQLGLSKDSLRTEHLVAAAENIHGPKTLETVLGLVDHEYKITEEILVSAAKNQDYGDRMLDLLLHHPSCQQSITKRAAMAAAVDAGFPKEIMEILMKPEDSRLLNAGNVMDPDSHLPITKVMYAILNERRSVAKGMTVLSAENAIPGTE